MKFKSRHRCLMLMMVTMMFVVFLSVGNTVSTTPDFLENRVPLPVRVENNSIMLLAFLLLLLFMGIVGWIVFSVIKRYVNVRRDEMND